MYFVLNVILVDVVFGIEEILRGSSRWSLIGHRSTAYGGHSDWPMAAIICRTALRWSLIGRRWVCNQ